MGDTLRIHGSGVVRCAVLVYGVYVGCSLAQGIVPDGSSATTVSTAASGKHTVQIAPAAGGVSHNTYAAFNVGRSGADFINTGVNASLIVNEVTGAAPSLLQGRISVIGPRAHFILANPNGITVDGATFINTGNLALATGRVSFGAFDPGDGTTQRNVIVTTTGGNIDVGTQGLSGAFNTLELIAKTIRIAGAVNNTTQSGRTRLVAGGSRAEFNTAVDGFDALTPWVQHQSLEAIAPAALAVDITALGSLTAGRVEVIVADTGAGVRHAGTALASFGDFSISSSGDIEIAGGTLNSAGDLIVTAGNLSIHSRTDGTFAQIAANGNVELRVGQAALMSGSLTAGGNGDAGSIVIGVPGAGAGPLHLGHEIVAGTLSRFSASASGGIALTSIGQPLELDAALVLAQQNIDIDAASLTMDAAWLGTTPFAAQIQSSAGRVALNLSGVIESTGANMHGARGIDAHADALELVASRRGDRVEESAWSAAAGAIDLSINRDIHLVGSDLLAQTHLLAHSADFILEAEPQSGRRSSAIAATGALLAQASGTIRNSGSLLQGETRNAADVLSLGAVTLQAGVDIVNESTGPERVSAIFGRTDGVVLQAGRNVVNRSARVISNAALTVDAVGDVQNSIDKVHGAAAEQRQEFSRRESAFLFRSRRVSGYDQDFGTLAVPGQLAYLIGNSDVSIHARDVVVRGGEIDANAGSITIEAARRIEVEAVRTGALHFESRCLFTCSKSATSTVTLSGGMINAANNAHLIAGTELFNSGGRVLAVNDLVIEAPLVTARAMPAFTIVGLHPGLSGGLGTAWARVYAADQGGSFTANRGRLIVDGAVVIQGGSLSAPGGVIVRDGMTTAYEASHDAVAPDNHIGFFDWLW